MHRAPLTRCSGRQTQCIYSALTFSAVLSKSGLYMIPNGVAELMKALWVGLHGDVCVSMHYGLGLDAVRWSPDSRHLLTTASFQVSIVISASSQIQLQLRITIWSLVSQHISYIKFPKSAGAGDFSRCCSLPLVDQGLDFTPNGKFMAVLERRDGKDFVSVFACETWQLVLVSVSSGLPGSLVCH